MQVADFCDHAVPRLLLILVDFPHSVGERVRTMGSDLFPQEAVGRTGRASISLVGTPIASGVRGIRGGV